MLGAMSGDAGIEWGVGARSAVSVLDADTVTPPQSWRRSDRC